MASIYFPRPGWAKIHPFQIERPQLVGYTFTPSHSQNRMWWLYIGLRLAYTILTYQCCSKVFLRMYRPLEWDIVGHENIPEQAFVKARVISAAASLLSIFIGAHG